MAKRRFNISPKLNEASNTPKPLPVQKISVEDIEKIATGKSGVEEKPAEKKASPKKTKPKEKAPPVAKVKEQAVSKKAKQKQGRPRRIEPVKRLSSDLPAELYDLVKTEVRNNGYTLNGFLAKVLREYFENKKG